MTNSISANPKSHAEIPSHPTVIKHYHENKPVVLPYKPPEKGPPPGANLYNDVWDIFRVAVHSLLYINAPIPYLAGFSVGAIKSLYEWSENGAPKKISGDPARIDFGATAHTSSLLSQVSILAESALGVLIPISVDADFFRTTIEPLIEQSFPFPFKDSASTPKSSVAEYTALFSTESIWPSSWLQSFKWVWIFCHGTRAGQETIERMAVWLDPPKQK